MHVGNFSKGMIPGIAIVGGGIPVAAGMALAFKMQRSGQVAACFFGDGAVAEGAFHEGVNMAAIWNLPVVFACENNLYGASTHVSQVMRDTNIARRVASYGSADRPGRRQRRAGGLRSGAGGGGRLPLRPGARFPGTVDLPRHRPFPPRPGPLSAPGGARRLDRQRPYPAVRRRAQGAGRERRRPGGDPARLAAEFDQAVKCARKAPQPTIDDLTTDVFA